MEIRYTTYSCNCQCNNHLGRTLYSTRTKEPYYFEVYSVYCTFRLEIYSDAFNNNKEVAIMGGGGGCNDPGVVYSQRRN